MAGHKPPEAIWRPIENLPPEAERWGFTHYRECAGRWRYLRDRLQDPSVDRTLLDLWLRERNRAFAIETGQILEGRAVPAPGEDRPGWAGDVT